MRFTFQAALLLLLAASCAGAPPAETALRPKLDAGCKSHSACLLLWAEAQARVKECYEYRAESGCAPEQGDLALAQALLRPHERAALDERARADVALAAEARRQEDDARVRQAQELDASATRQRVRRAATEATAQGRARTQTTRSATYSRMGAVGRAKYLSDCFAAGGEVLAPELRGAEGDGAERLSCDRLLLRLVSASESEFEATRLMAQQERRLQALAPPSPPPPPQPTPSAAPEKPTGSGGRGLAVCCDGAVSPTCGCGDERGCCSKHGGVCGCME